MNQFPTVLTGLLFMISSCGYLETRTGNDIYNVKLESSYLDFQNSFKLERSKIVFDGNVTANNCVQYFDLLVTNKLSEAVYNQLVKSEYLECDALDILSRSKLSVNQKTSADFGESLADKLDLRSFPSSMYRASDEDKHTLSSIYQEDIKTTNTTAVYENNEWRVRFEVVATVNLNDNDSLDWIVWFSDEAKTGNYAAYLTLIIYDPEARDSFQAKRFP